MWASETEEDDPYSTYGEWKNDCCLGRSDYIISNNLQLIYKAQSIILKRSSLPGKVPDTGSLNVGEIAIRIYVNVDGRVVTLHTENGHLCQVVTTFSKGLTSLNNLTRQVQFLGTKLTIDNTEKTSTTAATPATITTSALTDDAEITIDIDQIGDGTAKGLKITLIGTR